MFSLGIELLSSRSAAVLWLIFSRTSAASLVVYVVVVTLASTIGMEGLFAIAVSSSVFELCFVR